MRVLLIAGTGTDVGKSWTAAALARTLRARGRSVAARKPAQSFDARDGLTDRDVLAAATGEAPAAVCPDHRCYPVPLAPPMAARHLGLASFTIAELVAELAWPGGADVGLVETAGGIRSPLAMDGDTADLARSLRPDATILVADAGLGTINAVRTCIGALRVARVAEPVVHLNRFDPDAPLDLHARNRDWLRDVDGLRVTTSIDELAAVADPA